MFHADRRTDRQTGRQTGRQADRQTDRETDATKLIVFSRNFSKVSKKEQKYLKKIKALSFPSISYNTL